jgi:hypothetical protein
LDFTLTGGASTDESLSAAHMTAQNEGRAQNLTQDVEKEKDIVSTNGDNEAMAMKQATTIDKEVVRTPEEKRRIRKTMESQVLMKTTVDEAPAVTTTTNLFSVGLSSLPSLAKDETKHARIDFTKMVPNDGSGYITLGQSSSHDSSFITTPVHGTAVDDVTLSLGITIDNEACVANWQALLEEEKQHEKLRKQNILRKQRQLVLQKQKQKQHQTSTTTTTTTMEQQVNTTRTTSLSSTNEKRIKQKKIKKKSKKKDKQDTGSNVY